MTSPRVIARPMLASMFVVGGINAVKNPDALAVRAKPILDRIVPLVHKAVPGMPVPDSPTTWVRLNGAAQLVGAAMLATGRFPRLAAVGLIASLVPTTLAGHRFWEEQDPAARTAGRNQFFKNVSTAGGLLLAALDRTPAKRRTKKKSDKDAG